MVHRYRPNLVAALVAPLAVALLAATASGTAVATASGTAAAASDPTTTAATDGFTIVNGQLHDGNGNLFVMRGVNVHHAWMPDKTTQALKDVKALGANTVRLVLSAGTAGGLTTSREDVAYRIGQCKAARLVCVLEVHDTTGFRSSDGAMSLAKAVDYWLSVKDALVGQERYAIINIGNEPIGSGSAADQKLWWTGDTKSAVIRLRDAGLTHTLMVDAPGWGQDDANVMRDNAGAVFGADALKNTIFSVHMYG
ncbi:MAG: cellulase family glycosylhydrolase, partial [Phycicoccus sp.]